MKKISVMLLAALMLFAFVACNDDANDGKVAALGASDKKIAQDAYAAVVKALGTPAADVPDGTTKVTVGNAEYTVKYSFDLTKADGADGADAKDTWKISIEVSNDKEGDAAYKMTFELGSADLGKNITVKVNDDSYTVAANDIKNGKDIAGVETDPEEQTPTDPDEETTEPGGDDTSGTGGGAQEGEVDGGNDMADLPDGKPAV